MSIFDFLANEKTDELTRLLWRCIARLYVNTCSPTEGESCKTIAALFYALEHHDVIKNTELANIFGRVVRLMFTDSPEGIRAADEWVKTLPAFDLTEAAKLAKHITKQIDKGNLHGLEHYTFDSIASIVREVTHPERYEFSGEQLAGVIKDDELPEEIRQKLCPAVGLNFSEAVRISALAQIITENLREAWVSAKDDQPEPAKDDRSDFYQLRVDAHTLLMNPENTSEQMRAVIKLFSDDEEKDYYLADHKFNERDLEDFRDWATAIYEMSDTYSAMPRSFVNQMHGALKRMFERHTDHPFVRIWACVCKELEEEDEADMLREQGERYIQGNPADAFCASLAELLEDESLPSHISDALVEVVAKLTPSDPQGNDPNAAVLARKVLPGILRGTQSEKPVDKYQRWADVLAEIIGDENLPDDFHDLICGAARLIVGTKDLDIDVQRSFAPMMKEKKEAQE